MQDGNQEVGELLGTNMQ